MIKNITPKINEKQIESIIDRMSMKFKLRLVRKLEKETLRRRWNEILKDIDKRIKKFPVSEKEIDAEIRAYRQQKHAQSHS